MIPTGPIVFPQSTNVIHTVKKGVHVVHIHYFMKLIDWFVWILSLGSHHTPHMFNVTVILKKSEQIHILWEEWGLLSLKQWFGVASCDPFMRFLRKKYKSWWLVKYKYSKYSNILHVHLGLYGSTLVVTCSITMKSPASNSIARMNYSKILQPKCSGNFGF